MRARIAKWNREAARQVLQGMVLLALVLLLVPTARAGLWQCEGRVCGVTAGVCCCVLASERQDSECASAPSAVQSHRLSVSHGQEVGNCPSACHCTMVAPHAQEPRAAVQAASAPSLDVVAMPPAAWQTSQPVASEAARPSESRGPPPLCPALSSTSPRGPPLR